MKKLLLSLLLFAMPLQAKMELLQHNQTSDGADPYDTAFPRNVTTGNKIIVVWSGSTRGGLNSVTVSDTLTTSFSLVHNASVTGASCPLAGDEKHTYIWEGVASSSGANTVTVDIDFVTSTFRNMVVIYEFSGLGTFDLADSDTYATAPSNPTSPTIVTTGSGGFLLAAAGSSQDNRYYTNDLPFFETNDALNLQLGYAFSGASGNQSASFTGGTGGGCAIITIAAWKASALAIVTLSTIDAIQNQAFSQTLSAEGGSGSYTWTLDSGSLPSGITLSSSGVISGTTSINGPNSITVKVTDGVAATDTQAYTFNVGTEASQQTLSLVQAKKAIGLSTVVFTSNVTSGNLIVLTAAGELVRGWHKPFDSLGTSYSRLCGVAGSNFATNPNITTLEVWFGVAPSTGANTVSYATGLGAIATSLVVSEFSSAQAIPDLCNVSRGTESTPNTYISDSFSSISPNEELVASSAFRFSSPSNCTATANSPFTQTVAGKDRVLTATDTKVTPSSYTASFTLQGTCTTTGWGILMTGIFPTLTDFTPTPPSNRSHVYIMQ